MPRKKTGRTTHNLTVSIPIEMWDYISRLEKATGLTKSRIVTCFIKNANAMKMNNIKGGFDEWEF